MRALLDAATQVTEEWRDLWPLTARQIYYALVARGALPKTEAGYARLLDVLNRGRRSGRVPWEALRDDGARTIHPGGYADASTFVDGIRISANAYRRDRQGGQPVRVELWAEAAGMLPQLAATARDYGVPVASSGGFDSVTAKHGAALRIARRGVPTQILHVGDYDASGCSIVDSAAEDIGAFLAGLGAPAGWVKFQRVAVTPEQISSLGLPTAPPKATDRRGEAMAETVQAEAIPPAQLARIVTAAIEAELDLEIRGELLAVEATERAELVARVAELFR